MYCYLLCVDHSIYVKVGGQLVGVGSLLPFGSLGLYFRSSWWQATLICRAILLALG